MSVLINNENLNLNYLSIDNKEELKKVLNLENEQRLKEGKKPLTLEELELKDIIISKKEDKIDGYSITNFTFDENHNINILIERLHMENNNEVLHNALFESAIFVAVEKASLNKNLIGEQSKIISSSIIINGHTIFFNITKEYIERNLSTKFNKDAVREKIDTDKKYREERKKVEDKISANTFYNDTGHRFHSNLDEKTGNLSVVENDFDILDLDERLKVIQMENMGKQDLKLNDAYAKFEKEKIDSQLKNTNSIDSRSLNGEQKELISSATIMTGEDDVKVDLENDIAFDKDNKKIEIGEKKEMTEQINEILDVAKKSNIPAEMVREVLNSKSVDWKNLDKSHQDKIITLYGLDLEKQTMTNTQNLSNNKSKKLALRNNKEAAYISSVVISFITGLAAGIFTTLLLMFLGK